MAFLQPLTANLTPHPAPVAPLADPEWANEELQAKYKVAKWGVFCN